MNTSKPPLNHFKNRIYFVLLLCFCLMGAIQPATGQNGTVILPTRELTVRQAFAELTRQTGHKIVVNWDNLDPDKKTMMPANRLQTKELLAHALAGTGYSWEMQKGQIAITRSAAAGDDCNNRDTRSTMNRKEFDRSRMSFVPDPWSRTQLPFENMADSNTAGWNDGTENRDSLSLVMVNYRVNSSTVEQNYMDNAHTLEIIHRTLTNKDVLAHLDYVVVTAGSSPEGNTAVNEKLAANRALAMKSYLMWKYPFLDRDMIYTFSVGEDWSGLRRMVEESTSVPHREEVLSVMDEPVGNDIKRARLKAVGGGTAYNYIARNMLPRLRGAAAVSIHYKPEPKPTIIVEERHIIDTVYIEKTEKIEMPVIVKPEMERHPLFAVKTNLLFDAASALNVEVEIPIGKRWSVAAEYVFPWWLYEKKQKALESLGGTLEGRYWFGNRDNKAQLTGWFAGVYAGGGYYDIEWKTKGYQGEFFHAGFSGGYAHSINKNGRLRMEYSLGLGYMGTKYRKYAPVMGTDNEWHLVRRKRGTRNWFGPTRAKISLAWMLNHGYREKGGVK